MNKKALISIILVLVLCAVAYFTLQRPEEQSLNFDDFEDLLKLDTNQIQKIEVIGGVMDLLVLEKDSIWKITDPIVYPIQPQRINMAMRMFANSKVRYKATEKPSKHEYFKVTDDAPQLKVYSKDSLVAHWYIGKIGANTRQTFVRKPGFKEVFLVDGPIGQLFNSLDVDWRDPVIINFDPEKIEKFELKFENEHALVEKVKGNWEAMFEMCDSNEVYNFLYNLNLKPADFFADDEDDLSKYEKKGFIKIDNKQIDVYQLSEFYYLVKVSDKEQVFKFLKGFWDETFFSPSKFLLSNKQE